METVVAIMCGGAGTRFWPASTKNNPKQFLSFFDDKPLIYDAYERALKITDKDKIFMIATEHLAKHIKKHFSDMKEENIILEPDIKSTAPCLTYSVLHISNLYENANMVVLPSDHIIPDHNAFKSTIEAGLSFLKTGNGLLTLGIKPNYPETGYGYIKTSNPIINKISKVEAFVEKPNLENATKYVNEKSYFWNAGIFIWNTDFFLKELQTCNDKIYRELILLKDQIEKNNFFQIDKIYKNITPISIDYALLEKSQNVYVIPCDFKWDDVGSWLALENFSKKLSSGKGNVANEVSINSSDNIIYAPNKTIALMDVKDLIIINTDNVLMVMPKSKAQDVKELLNKIKADGHLDLV